MLVPHRSTRGLTLVEMLIAIGISAIVLGAVITLHLQGVRMYRDVVTSDWATFDAAFAVQRLEGDISECYRVLDAQPNSITLSMPRVGVDLESGAQVPLYPLAHGDAVRYYLSDLSGRMDATGTYLWRQRRDVAAEAFERDDAPLGRSIVELQFQYDTDADGQAGKVQAVHVTVKASSSEGGTETTKTHTAILILRNADHGPAEGRGPAGTAT